MSFTAGLGVFQGFSLIELGKGRSSFRLHRSVQLSTVTWLEQQGKLEECRLEASELLTNIYSEHWEEFQSLDPHIYAFKDLVPPTAESAVQFLNLVCSLAIYQRESGRHLYSYSWLNRANSMKLAGPVYSMNTHFANI